MAQETVVILIDDLNGEEIPKGKGKTVRFGLDHQDYEIDLHDQNIATFRDAVQRYINAGRIVKADKAARNGHKVQTPRKPPTKQLPTSADPRSRCRYCGKLGR